MRPAPADFGPDFLSWLKEATERAWRDIEEWSAADFEAAGLIGTRWGRGTHWTGGLSDAAIDDVQQRYSIEFPRQHRLFLQTLHSTTPRQRGFSHGDGSTPVPRERPGFYDWNADDVQIGAALRWPLDGLVADTAEGQYWHRSWGPCPKSTAGRRERLAELIDGAPRLIPIFGHRYVVADESERVLSVYGDDIIVYGYDLRDYLLHELEDVLGIEYTRPQADLPDIPFWQHVIDMD